MNANYSKLLNTPQWYQKRKQILQRDGNKCRHCSSTVSLNVHHRQYHKAEQSGYYLLPWKYHDRYLITLCEECHHAGHANYNVPTFNINHN
jgi:5-methylcytosine-specific restriction endonuclease McrA